MTGQTLETAEGFLKKDYHGGKMNRMSLGGGGRFERLTRSIGTRGKVSNPEAVAAAIGRKKYGAEKMARMAAIGRKRQALAGGR